MKAIMVSEPGGPEVLRMGEMPIPEPGPGEVLVRVLSAGVGPWDAHLRSGQLPAAQLPFIPGAEFAGIVVGDTGAEAAFEDGEPVYGYPALVGCYAEYVTCPSEQLAPIPAGLTAADAGAVPVDALTAFQGLTDILGVGAGDQVLITAAAGGLGHFAVQIARSLGANVIATASPQHHDFVHKLGAEIVVDHTRPDWADQVRQESGGGSRPECSLVRRRPWPGLPAQPAMARCSPRLCTPTSIPTATGCSGSTTTARPAAAT